MSAPNAGFGISTAQIVGLWMETLFMGIYLVSCGFALQAFLWHHDGKLKKRTEIHWVLFVTAICLCIVAVFDVALGLMHNIQAFIQYRGADGSDGKFTDISSWVNVMKSVTVILQMIMGDGMLIYRCWVVYARSYLPIIVPILFYLGDISTGIVIIYRESTLHAKVLVNSGYIKPVFTAFYIASISLNILTTFLIVVRIWKVERENAQFRAPFYSSHSLNTSERSEPQSSSSRRRSTRLGRLIRIIIESGLIITLTSFISVITYVTGSNSIYPTSDVLVQNIGIAFNLIVIRARSRPSDEYTIHTQPISGTGFRLAVQNMNTVGPTGHPDVGEVIELEANSRVDKIQIRVDQQMDSDTVHSLGWKDHTGCEDGNSKHQAHSTRV